MNEIELKAHVKNKDEVMGILNASAEYKGFTTKSDVYYTIPSKKKPVTIRIRTESDDMGHSIILFTYKRKELLLEDGKAPLEVNEEDECTLSDAAPIIKMIEAAGGEISLKKQKEVHHWFIYKNRLRTHVELCTVPPLGDFLELEIVTKNSDEQTIQKARETEEYILNLCKIPLSEVEAKPYKELLKEAFGVEKN